MPPRRKYNKSMADKVNDFIESMYQGWHAVQPYFESTPSDPYSAMLRMASDSELKDLFRSMSKRLHPDAPGGNADKMAMLNAAYGMIKEDRKQASAGANAETRTK